MKLLLVTLATIAVASGAQAGSRTGQLQQLHFLTSEPPIGGMRMNQVIYVDDHTCPVGRVKMVMAPEVYNGPRRRSCVPR